MARGAAKQRTRPKPAPAPRKRTGGGRQGGYGAIEQTLFFPRLRRRAKWVFVFLAGVFAIGFVFFGVGSGSTGVSDILKGNFNIFGGGGGNSAISKAQKHVKKHPSDPQAWKDLALAYQQQKGKDAQANDAYTRYLHFRPRDYDALLQVAGYYSGKGDKSFRAGFALQGQAPVSPAAAYGLDPTSPLAQALGRDELSQSLSQQANTDFQTATTAFRQAEPYYQRATKLRPDDQFTLFEYGRTADLAGDTPGALAAYHAFLKKSSPSDPTAAQVRQRIAQLSATVRPQRRR